MAKMCGEVRGIDKNIHVVQLGKHHVELEGFEGDEASLFKAFERGEVTLWVKDGRLQAGPVLRVVSSQPTEHASAAA